MGKMGELIGRGERQMKKKGIQWLAILLAALLLPAGAMGESDAALVQVTRVECDGAVVGQCALPAEYTVSSQVSYCGAGQSLSHPIQLEISGISPAGDRLFAYASPAAYVQYLDYTMNGAQLLTHQDGQWDVNTMTTMLTFSTAAGYADRVMTGKYPGVQITVADEAEIPPEAQAQVDAHTRQMYDQMTELVAGDGTVSVDDAFFDVAQRSYEMQIDGVDYRAVVTTAVEAYQMTQNMAGDGLQVHISYIIWDVPFVYLMLTPAAEYEAAMGEYELFVLNTSASDGFTNACMQLSNQIRESVINSRSLAAGETACRSGVQGLTESEYDYTQERFSDYLFSQDDYTAADGRHVKVPNRYDYVYGDEMGNIYATDNALDVPQGMTQLEKNR